MTPAGDMARVLRAYVDAYLQEIGQLTYADLCAVQEPPHASVAYGAAGVAYALCRAGETLANRELLRQAWRWAGWARDGARRRGAFDDPGDARRVSRHALFYGRLGIHAVRARIAHAQRRRAAFRREGAGYSRCWRRGPDRPLDLVEGVARPPAGAAPLLLIEPNAPLRRLAAARAAALAERARAWTPSRDDTSFAHGWPGGAYALLRWFYSLGQEVPQWLVARCLRLCDLRPAYGLALEPRRPRYLPSSWCNGAAGGAPPWGGAVAAPRPPPLPGAARPARPAPRCPARGGSSALLRAA